MWHFSYVTVYVKLFLSRGYVKHSKTSLNTCVTVFYYIWVFFIVCQVIAMYDYMANNEDELSFSKGQLINVLSKDDADWWQGEIGGVTGLFPSNYVKMTTDSDPSQQCKQLLFFISFVTLFQRCIAILLLCVWNLEFQASAEFIGTLNNLQ